MAIKLQKTNSAITGNNFIADERIKQAEILTKQGAREKWISFLLFGGR